MTTKPIVTREHREAAWRALYAASRPINADWIERGDASEAWVISKLPALAKALAEAEHRGMVSAEPRWISVSDELPDSDEWVLAVSHDGDHVIVQLEITDDSEGLGEEYWAAEGGDLALYNYPYWTPLPNPPAAPQPTKET